MLVTPIFPHSINCSFLADAPGTPPPGAVWGPAICGAVHIVGMCIGSPSAPGRGRGGAHSAGEYRHAYMAVVDSGDNSNLLLLLCVAVYM